VPQSSLAATSGVGGVSLARLTLGVHNGIPYARSVLRSFRDKDTERVWLRRRSRWLDVPTRRAALRKRLILDAADRPGNVEIVDYH